MFEINVIYNEADSLYSCIKEERLPISFFTLEEAFNAYNSLLEHHQMVQELKGWSFKKKTREDVLKDYQNKPWFFKNSQYSYYEETQLIYGTQLINCYWVEYHNSLITIELLDVSKKIKVIQRKDF